MRRLHLGALSAALSVLALSLLLAGCGGGKDKDKDVGDEEGPPKKGGPKITSTSGGGPQLLEAKGTTTIKGVIKAQGDSASILKALTDKLLKDIDTKPDSKAQCLAGSEEEKTAQEYRIGKNGQVGNVFVWIMPLKGYAFKIDQKLVDEAKAHPVEIDQPHCAFLPHAAVAFPEYPDLKNPRDLVSTGQKFLIVNSAHMSHNTQLNSLGSNSGFNQTLSENDKKEVKLNADSKNEIILKCGIHPWMNATVWAFDHPFATVSKSDTAPKALRVSADDKDFGTFEIKNVPAGVKVRLYVWHEKNKYLPGGDGKEIDTTTEPMTLPPFDLQVQP
jgi:hypothetical protein